MSSFCFQNIRNNKTHARTPKWAQRYGLIDTADIRRKERKSQWASRYNDRLPYSTLEGRPYEEGQEQGSSIDLSSENQPHRQPNGDLWRPEDESYYSKQSDGSSGGRWRYPANFDDAVMPSKPKKKKKEKKDRWARTEDAYSISEEQSHRKKSKRKKSRSSLASESYSRDDSTEFPEDPEGGVYGNSSGRGTGAEELQERTDTAQTTSDDVFEHQF